MKRIATVFIMLAIGSSIVFAQDKKPEQKAVFCAEQIFYAKKTANSCQRRCAKYKCSAQELIDQGWSIKITNNKELIVEEFEIIPGRDKRKVIDTNAFEEICYQKKYECFQEGIYWFFWYIPPIEKGCKCIGKEYILER